MLCTSISWEKFYGEGEVSGKTQDEYGESLTIEIHSIGFMAANISDKDYKNLSTKEKDDVDEEEVLGKKWKPAR